MKDTIGYDGCACGDYESENLIAVASCRKSKSSPDCSLGVAHLLRYSPKNDEGLKEIGTLIARMFDYAGDCVVVERNEDLNRDPLI